MSLPPPPDPRALLQQAGFGPKKSWGQNFLLDQRVLADIARLAGAAPGKTIVELGAGLGALTYHLLAAGARVVAVERDRELVPILRDVLRWADGLEILEADAARLDYAALRARLGVPLTVTGNLPYQLSSRILVELSDAAPSVERAVLMVQREVAERLSAGPGSRTYGLLSVLVQRSFTVREGRDVPPGAFLPPPKVHSTVVVCEAHGATRDAATDRALVATSRAAFHNRRKTLKNSLSTALAAPAAQVDEAIRAAAVDPTRRAETLDLPTLERLALELRARDLLQKELTS